jgi:hypothetical protein
MAGETASGGAFHSTLTTVLGGALVVAETRQQQKSSIGRIVVITKNVVLVDVNTGDFDLVVR